MAAWWPSVSGFPQYDRAPPPPSAPWSEGNEDADLVAITPTPIARVAGASLALAGFFTGLLGVQSASLLRFRGLGAIAVGVMLTLGLTTLVCGWKVARMRGWAALGGTLCAASIALMGLAWVVYLLAHGVISLLAVAIVPLAAIAALLGALVIGSGRRADAARRRLRDAGLEAGD